MSRPDHVPRPWLLDLATRQRGSGELLANAAYDDRTQMTYCAASRVAVIDTEQRTQTKKADREIGEDQKL